MVITSFRRFDVLTFCVCWVVLGISVFRLTGSFDQTLKSLRKKMTPLAVTCLVLLMVPGYHFKDYTAGMSPCRDGHSCDYHGYDYVWCYTTPSNHWDYCCTSRCWCEAITYQHCAYICESGDKGYGQYCGSSGETTKYGDRCNGDFPCGHHLDRGWNPGKVHWCYTGDTWDYCCIPQERNFGDRCRTSYAYVS